MKRYLTSATIILMVLSACLTVFGQDADFETQQRWQSLSEQERQAFRIWLRERYGARDRGRDTEQQLKMLEAEIEKLKAERGQFMVELTVIRELAKKDGAIKTIEGIEYLISKYQQAFEDKLQILQQRLQRLQKSYEQRVIRNAEAVKPTRKAPDFTLKTFDDKTVSLSDYKGKVVVLEWFNLECPFSRYHYDKASTMVNLANKYKNKKVVWLAINSTSHTTPEQNLEFAREHSLPFPILDDRSGKVGREYRARTTPHVFIIDRNGYIAYDGAIDDSPLGRKKNGVMNYVNEALAELTTGKPVSLPKIEPYGCSVKYER